MDLQTTIANAVTIIGGSVGFGAFFDQVLITRATRSRIREFIKRSDQRENWQDIFFKYISLINDSVFHRFFSSPFFSLRYFCSCVVVSLFFLAIVVALQVLIFGSESVNGLSFTRPQLTVFAVCFCINLIIDWISIGQTQAFFSISAEQRTVSRAVLLIVSDFILTINFFTIIYAQPLAYLVVSSAIWRDEAALRSTVIASKSTLSQEDEKTLDSKVFGKGQEIDSSVFFVESISTWKALNDLDNSEEFQEVGINFPFFSDRFSRMYAYTIAYSNIDTVQDGFPGSVLAAPSFLSIKDLLLAYFREIENSQTGNALEITACGKRVDGKMTWTSATDTKDCDGKIIFLPSQVRDVIARAKVQDDIFEDAKVPLNSLFSTSLAATTLLYIAAFFLLVSRQFFQKLISGIASVEDFFLRSPFAWIGLITGVTFFVVSCIF